MRTRWSDIVFLVASMYFSAKAVDRRARRLRETALQYAFLADLAGIQK